MAAPTGTELISLAGHLDEVYGVRAIDIQRLDQGVFRVSLAGGPLWVARVFSAARPREGVEGDAAILRALERRGFPAERGASPQPVSSLDGQPVLVTEYVEPGPRLAPGRQAAILGVLLGRLQASPATGLRAGGAWHHLSFSGGPGEEIAAAAALLEDELTRVSPRRREDYRRLLDQVASAEDCRDLPQAFVHPDFVPANAIPTTDGGLVIVDWSGAGTGPRLWSLAFLLWALGARSRRLVEVAVARYRRHLSLEPAELDRLGGAMRTRPLLLASWSLCAGRRTIAQVQREVAEADALAGEIAVVARRGFESGDD